MIIQSECETVQLLKAENQNNAVPKRSTDRKFNRKRILRILRELILGGAITYILFGQVFGIAVVRGNAMKPDIQSGSLILFFRLDKQPTKGNIVIFTTSGDKNFLVRRVIAKGGDTVNINDKKDMLAVSGNQGKTSYVLNKTINDSDTNTYPIKVPVESIFVLGDNSGNSLDSRQLGVINLRRVVGTTFLVLKVP